jgi:hypothetical protein
MRTDRVGGKRRGRKIFYARLITSHVREPVGRDLLPREGRSKIQSLSPASDHFGRRDRLGGLTHEYYREVA